MYIPNGKVVQLSIFLLQLLNEYAHMVYCLRICNRCIHYKTYIWH